VTTHDDAQPGFRLSPVLEVAWAFLRLGCTSFGGPIAHVGYFRAEFVERRKWLDDAHLGDLVALSQFLPGPASSQTVFALGACCGKKNVAERGAMRSLEDHGQDLPRVRAEAEVPPPGADPDLRDHAALFVASCVRVGTGVAAS